jgi:hypothetical protein
MSRWRVTRVRVILRWDPRDPLYLSTILRHPARRTTIPKGIETMDTRIAKTLLVAWLGAMAMTANAQGAPATADKKLSDTDIRAFKDGRRACNQLAGAQREECRKQLAAKYVDKQCRNLTGDKLDECLKAEYPGE